jgi:hypothetical protein
MSEEIRVRCPACRTLMKVPADRLDGPIRCSQCQKSFRAKPKIERAPKKDPSASETQPARTASPALTPADQPVTPRPEPSAAVSPSKESAASVPLALLASLPQEKKTGQVRRMIGLCLLLVAIAVGGFFYREVLAGWSRFADLFADHSSTDTADNTLPAKSPRYPAKTTPVKAAAPFPRRLLAIGVGNYMYAEPVNLGKSARGIKAVVDRLASQLRVPDDQVYVVSDAVPASPPPTKAVIEQAVGRFQSTSRPQDRVMLLFTGHAVELDGQPYLVPLEGDLTVKESLLPAEWLLNQLASCPARQKILVIDVCRRDPSRGEDSPGAAPMRPKLDALLKDPPAGVQVWSACVAGQHSYELDQVTLDSSLVQGSVFLSLLATSSREGGRVPKPEDALPIEPLSKQVDPEVKKLVKSHAKAEQTPRLAGAEPAGGVAYDANQSPPPRFDLVRPIALAPGAAPFAEVQAIFREVAVPPLHLEMGHGRVGETPEQQAGRLATIFPFAAERLKPYASGVGPAKAPLRAAVVKTVESLDRQGRLSRVKVSGKEEPIKDPTLEIKAGTTEALKKSLSESQKGGPAVQIVELTDLLEEMEKVGEKRGEEPSKRWQAHYDYVLAELKSRLALVHEYNTMLAKVKRDELPSLDPKSHRGWRLVPQEKLQSPKEVKDFAADAKKIYAKLIRENPGTPWEVLAKRGLMTPLGLAWVPVPK